MSTPSPLIRRSLAQRWAGVAPWTTVRGADLAELATTPGLERLHWYDGGLGSLRDQLSGDARSGSMEAARAVLAPAFAGQDQGLYQVAETGRPPWTCSVAPVADGRYVVAHTVWVQGSLELRVAEVSALVVGSLLLDLATALPRLAPADRPPIDPPGSGRSGHLPADTFRRLAAGELHGPAAVEAARAAGWEPGLAAGLAEAFHPPVLAVSSLSVAAVDDDHLAVRANRLWVARSGWSWQAEDLVVHGADEPHREVSLTRLGPDDAIRTVFEPLPWFTRWGRTG